MNKSEKLEELDAQQKKIITELIKNPRITDNQLAKKTKIPVNTVNRKRKLLENTGLLNYYTFFNTSSNGTGTFGAAHMYLLTFKAGITREQFLQKTRKERPQKFALFLKHVSFSFIGEHHGKLCVMMIIESRLESDIIEIFNAEIIPYMKSVVGQDSIEQTKSIRISSPLSLFHNYLPESNQKDGKIIESWPDSLIFVDD